MGPRPSLPSRRSCVGNWRVHDALAHCLRRPSEVDEGRGRHHHRARRTAPARAGAAHRVRARWCAPVRSLRRRSVHKRSNTNGAPRVRLPGRRQADPADASVRGYTPAPRAGWAHRRATRGLRKSPPAAPTRCAAQPEARCIRAMSAAVVSVRYQVGFAASCRVSGAVDARTVRARSVASSSDRARPAAQAAA
jgi:hypothetical protein